MPSFDPTPADTAVLLVDVQERFLPAIPAIAPDQPCGRACRILLEGAALLGVPVVISEQYPKGLGATLPALRAAAPAAPVFAKTHFSCCGDEALDRHLDALGRGTVVVCGVEAHVCVLATVADLLQRGRRVLVAADAVASRSDANRDLAIQAMRDLGALALPVESLLFRLQRVAGTGAFKQLSALVR